MIARITTEQADALHALVENIDVENEVVGIVLDRLLTDKERAAIRIAGDLWGALCDIVADTDPVVRLGDLQELIAPIHVIQRYIMGQAAARAYPTEFRLLGSTIER